MPDKPGVYVTNLREVRQLLSRIEPNLLPVLRNELQAAVETTVLPGIFRRLPTGPDKGGHVRQSVKATGGGNTVYIQAGTSARYAYYGWLDFGGTLKPTGKRRNTQRRPIKKSGRYIYPSIAEASDKLAIAAGRAVDRVNPT